MHLKNTSVRHDIIHLYVRPTWQSNILMEYKRLYPVGANPMYDAACTEDNCACNCDRIRLKLHLLIVFFSNSRIFHCIRRLAITAHESVSKQRYSVLKLSTGLVMAALIACEHTMSNAIATVPSPASANIHHAISIL